MNYIWWAISIAPYHTVYVDCQGVFNNISYSTCHTLICHILYFATALLKLYFALSAGITFIFSYSESVFYRLIFLYLISVLMKFVMVLVAGAFDVYYQSNSYTG